MAFQLFVKVYFYKEYSSGMGSGDLAEMDAPLLEDSFEIYFFR